MTTSADGPGSVLTVARSQEGAAAVVALHGELDMSTLTVVQDELDAIGAGLPELLVIDMSELGFVDSSGVRLVLLAEDRARAEGRSLKVRLGQGAAYRLFRTLGLADRFAVVDDSTP